MANIEALRIAGLSRSAYGRLAGHAEAIRLRSQRNDDFGD
jgi:hypothetical protein